MWKTIEAVLYGVLFVFQFYPVCIFGTFISILDLALSGVKGLSYGDVSLKTNQALTAIKPMAVALKA